MSHLLPPSRGSAGAARPSACPAAALRGGSVPFDVPVGLLAPARNYLHACRLGLEAGPSLREAWRAFFAALDPLIRALIRACRCPASRFADGVQEVWTVLVDRLPGFRHDPARGRFRDWLYVVVRRTVGRLGRRDARAVPGPTDLRSFAGIEGRESDPAEAYARRDRDEQVRRTLAEPRDRSDSVACRAAWLHWGDERPVAEVAAELHLSTGQLRDRLRRAKRTLRPRLDGDGFATS